MQLVFKHPEKLDNLEILLATKGYEDIWLSDGAKIIERLEHYTGLKFQQDVIEVAVHDGQSMSGKTGMPMRLNMNNHTLAKKRLALIHELAHRLLFGNGLYAPDDVGPLEDDEFRVMLFEGDVIKDLYGEEEYEYWSCTDPEERVSEHIERINRILSLSKEKRLKMLHEIIAKQKASD